MAARHQRYLSAARKQADGAIISAAKPGKQGELQVQVLTNAHPIDVENAISRAFPDAGTDTEGTAKEGWDLVLVSIEPTDEASALAKLKQVLAKFGPGTKIKSKLFKPA